MQKRSSRSLEKKLRNNAIKNVKKFLQELCKYIRIEEAYLFGSYVKNTWLKTSDIDLVVVSPDFKNMKYIDRLELIHRVQWRLKLDHYIEVIPLTPEEFKEKIDKSIVLRDARKYWIKIR